MNLNCENNGLNYVLEMPGDEARLDMKGNIGLNFTIRQGRLQQQTFGSTGEAFQSLQLGYPNNFLIDQFLVNVYVNGERWENYQSMLDIPPCFYGISPQVYKELIHLVIYKKATTILSWLGLSILYLLNRHTTIFCFSNILFNNL
jgi:hypothetical protein